MMNAIIGQLSFEDKKDLTRYHPCYLRRQVVAHFVLFKDLLKVWMRDNIRSVYGGLEKEGGVGPFSVKGYLKYILQDKKWGDSIFLGLVASMWACRITILRADNGREIKYRYNLSMGGTDIGMLFNGKPESGHYSALWRMDGQFMTSRPITLSTGYDEKVDEMERKAMAEDSEGKKGLDKSEIVLKKERFEELLKKEQMFDEMCKVIEAGRAMQKRRRLSGSISGNQKKGEGKGDNVEVVEKEKVVAKDIQEVKKGDTMCEVCEIEYPSNQALEGHVMKCHEGKYRYVCSICEKGYMVKESLTRHLAEHSGDKKVIKYPISGCKSTFVWRKLKEGTLKYITVLIQIN